MASLPNYWSVLAAVSSQVSTLTILAGIQIKIRPELAFVQGVDVPPFVVIAPRRDTWEQIKYLEMPNTAVIGYPVVIGLIRNNDFDLATLQWQMTARDAVRHLLFNPTVLQAALSSTFDVEYEPNPKPRGLEALAAVVDPSVQEFIFISDETRSS